MAFVKNQQKITDIFFTDREFLDSLVGDRLFTWGVVGSGLLGDGSTVSRCSPLIQRTAGAIWSQVQISDNAHAAAIKFDGSLWLWGCNSSGQVGVNSVGTHGTIDQSFPVQMGRTLSGDCECNWKQVSLGSFHTAAIKTDGTLWSWGRNNEGQLGTNSTTSRSSPVQTTGPATNWRQVSAGDRQTAAIKTDGTLWLWGENQYGQLGDNSTTNRSTPVQVNGGGSNWKQISVNTQTIGLKTDGTLWAWGINSAGQLGINSTTNKSTPTAVFYPNCWKQINTGANFSSAIKVDGTLWSWGCNIYGQLGDNTTTNRSVPVQEVTQSTNWKQVSGKYLSQGAVKTDGTLWLWGWCSAGVIGDGANTCRSSPVQTTLRGTNWKQVAVGRAALAITFSEDIQ